MHSNAAYPAVESMTNVVCCTRHPKPKDLRLCLHRTRHRVVHTSWRPLRLTSGMLLPPKLRRCWQEQEEEIIDDCTAMVIYLQPAATASATGSLGSNSSSSHSGSSTVGSAAATAASQAQAAASSRSTAAKDLATRLGAGLNIKGPTAGGLSSSGSSSAAAAGRTAAKPAGHTAGGLLGYKRG